MIKLEKKIKLFFDKSSSTRNVLYKKDPVLGYEQDMRQKAVLELLEPTSNDIILDVGCGNARDTLKFAKKCKYVCGIDLSDGMIKEGKNDIERQNLKNAFLIVGSAMDLPFANTSFDKISCSEVIEHIPEWEEAIKEMCRCLKNNGRLVITTPNKRSIYRITNSIRNLIIKLLRRSTHPYDVWKTQEELIKIFQQNNIKVDKKIGVCYLPGHAVRVLPYSLKRAVTKIIYEIEKRIRYTFTNKGYILGVSGTKNNKASQFTLSQEILEGAKEFYKDGKNLRPDWINGVYDALKPEKYFEQLTSIQKDVNIDLKGKKILEIGSGIGSFLKIAIDNQIDCYGIEPSIIGIKTSVKRENILKDKIICAVGEKIPFKDESFDMVTSFQVLEHTQNPEEVIKESIRVLKKDGYLYFVIPNYNSFYEGHYGLLWLPRFPKRVAKLYVRLRGRAPSYIENLQYITPKMISNILSQEDVEIISWGVETWEQRLDTLNFSTGGPTKKLLHLAKLVHRLKITSLIKYLGKKLDFYYPIILVAKKK